MQTPPKTKGELWPAWKREFDRKKRRRLLTLRALGVFIILSFAGALGVRHWKLRGHAIEFLETFEAKISNNSTELQINRPPRKTEQDWKLFGDAVTRLPSLCVFQVTDGQFETIDFLKEHGQLKELGLKNCSKTSDFTALSLLKDLSVLNLQGTKISDCDASNIQWPEQLKEASFFRCENLTSKGVEKILATCREITKLELSAENITPEVVSHLNSLPIQELTIDGILSEELLSILEHRSRVRFVGVSDPSGRLH